MENHLFSEKERNQWPALRPVRGGESARAFSSTPSWASAEWQGFVFCFKDKPIRTRKMGATKVWKLENNWTNDRWLSWLKQGDPELAGGSDEQRFTLQIPPAQNSWHQVPLEVGVKVGRNREPSQSWLRSSETPDGRETARTQYIHVCVTGPMYTYKQNVYKLIYTCILLVGTHKI